MENCNRNLELKMYQDNRNNKTIIIENLACMEKKAMTIACYSKLFSLSFLVHGNYSMWSNWGTCSVSCGPGVKKRTRTCTNPEPEYGGLTCRERDLGSNMEPAKCNLGACPGEC